MDKKFDRIFFIIIVFIALIYISLITACVIIYLPYYFPEYF